MNWDMLSALGEIIGAAGVIISVSYLAIQIREGTRATRLAALQSMSHHIDGVLKTIIETPGVAELYLRGINSYEALDGADLPRFNSLMERFFRVYENAFYRSRAGQLETTTWHGMDSQVRDLLAYSGVQRWWSSRQQWFSMDFGEYIQGIIAAAGAPRMYREQQPDRTGQLL